MATANEIEQLRLYYEGIEKQDPHNVAAVHFLAIWHFERHGFSSAKQFYGRLVTLQPDDADMWLCFTVCCAMTEDYTECMSAFESATSLLGGADDDIRIKFCSAFLFEKKKDFPSAMDIYVQCLNQCTALANSSSSSTSSNTSTTHNQMLNAAFMKEMRGEIMLRIAIVKKDMGATDQAMQMCNSISGDQFGDAIRANALCLKGMLHEMKSEFPASEVVYRSVLQISTGHATALERLGRVYLRYRETIPAAVQCFFKSVETNPSNHVAWYLLGRCYMATSQYTDACEAYNRAVNLNPNDPQVWCSLGVLYYAFGQYREALGMLARSLKLDPTLADAWYNVGALYDMCDQPDDAQLAYMKAKENGLADRFARAGVGLNPLGAQMQHHGGGGAAGGGGGGGGSTASMKNSGSGASIGGRDINHVHDNNAGGSSSSASGGVGSGAGAHHGNSGGNQSGRGGGSHPAGVADVHLRSHLNDADEAAETAAKIRQQQLLQQQQLMHLHQQQLQQQQYQQHMMQQHRLQQQQQEQYHHQMQGLPPNMTAQQYSQLQLQIQQQHAMQQHAMQQHYIQQQQQQQQGHHQYSQITPQQLLQQQLLHQHQQQILMQQQQHHIDMTMANQQDSDGAAVDYSDILRDDRDNEDGDGGEDDHIGEEEDDDDDDAGIAF